MYGHAEQSADEPQPGAAEQWPPAINVELGPVAATLPSFRRVFVSSIATTVGLFVGWTAFSAYAGAIADYVMPILLGLSLSYCWRMMGFRLSLHLMLLWQNIAVLGACSIAAWFILAKLTPPPLSGVSWTRIEHSGGWRMPVELALIVAASLIGRVIYAPKRSTLSVRNGEE